LDGSNILGDLYAGEYYGSTKLAKSLRREDYRALKEFYQGRQNYCFCNHEAIKILVLAYSLGNVAS
jgi:hypothetical protein